MSLPMVNRSAITLIAKPAFLDWLNSCPDSDPTLTMKDLNYELLVYLIPEQEADPDEWLEKNYQTMFREELDGWYTDETW